jgi:hypothetical protein
VRGEGRGARGLVLHLQLLSTGIEGYYEVLASGAQARWRRRYRGMLGRGSGQAGRPKEVHGVSRAGSRDRRGAVWHDASGIINARPGWEKLWECSTQTEGPGPGYRTARCCSLHGSHIIQYRQQRAVPLQVQDRTSQARSGYVEDLRTRPWDQVGTSGASSPLQSSTSW